MPPGKTWLWLVGVLLANYLVVRFLVPGPEAPVAVPYTLFKEQVGKSNVEAIYSQGESITGRFKAPVTYPPVAEKSAAPGGATQKPSATGAASSGAPKTASNFTTTLPSFVDPGLEAFLIENGVEISAKPIDEGGGPLSTLLFGFGPALLFIGFYIWMFRRAAQQGGGIGGLMGIGKSKARRYDQEKDTKVTFNDVAGIDEAENELVEIVDFLRDPPKYTRLGGTAPKGVLLIGAPGTGKTLLAKAVAGEAGVPFFSMSAAEFVEMIVGVGAARVRDLFKQAREQAPAIVFIDELDAIGRARGQMAIGGSSEQEQTLNQILTEMDGFSSREGIIVLAATNQPEVLDKALLRPGRFDRRVVVNLPDRTGREAILKVHTRGVPLANDVILAELAAATPGFSGADLKNLVNEAALLAARRGKSRVDMSDFEDAKDKVMLGVERRSLVLSDEERKLTAYHEAGHALVSLRLPGLDPVHKVTIVPRGRALGITFSLPEEDRHNYTKEYIHGRLAMAYGGRVAEEIIFGPEKVTTGAAQDIQQATEMARRMVTQFGMSDAVGPIAVGDREHQIFLGREISQRREVSEKTAEVVDAEVKRILDEAFTRARSILDNNMDVLHKMAQALLERETLDRDDVEMIAAGKNLPPRPPAVAVSTQPDRAVTEKAARPHGGPILGAPPAEPAGA